MPEELKESYWIRIKEKNKQKYGLILYDHDYLTIYTRKTAGYEIINKPGLKFMIYFNNCRIIRCLHSRE
ncbi:MAG: hypothetical protein C6W56_08210 [Caldibacillus debilis]|nr:MAG: hypothetical protein C6W56_08210 [Caldibacillus debilis]